MTNSLTKYRTQNGIIINNNDKTIPPDISRYISHIWNEETRQWDEIEKIAVAFSPKETTVKPKVKKEWEIRREMLEKARSLA